MQKGTLAVNIILHFYNKLHQPDSENSKGGPQKVNRQIYMLFLMKIRHRHPKTSRLS